MLVVINPSGPVHTVFTVTRTSTAGLNSTVHVRVTLAPMGQIGLTGLLLMVTKIGAGTVINKKKIKEVGSYYIPTYIVK